MYNFEDKAESITQMKTEYAEINNCVNVSCRVNKSKPGMLYLFIYLHVLSKFLELCTIPI